MRTRRHNPASARRRQSGAVLLVAFVILFSIVAAATLVPLLRGSARHAIDARIDDALRQAGDALAGDARQGVCLGLGNTLPCPSVTAACGLPETPDCSAAGWLPWNSLNLPPTRDAAGQCVRYERTSPTTARLRARRTGATSDVVIDIVAPSGCP